MATVQAAGAVQVLALVAVATHHVVEWCELQQQRLGERINPLRVQGALHVLVRRGGILLLLGRPSFSVLIRAATGAIARTSQTTFSDASSSTSTSTKITTSSCAIFKANRIFRHCLCATAATLFQSDRSRAQRSIRSQGVRCMRQFALGEIQHTGQGHIQQSTRVALILQGRGVQHCQCCLEYFLRVPSVGAVESLAQDRVHYGNTISISELNFPARLVV
mmetsp:Transcript_16060/g.26931  ORF Transcript_16060/g.26931 Transcript_16060/m.26931 type:complete len:220 (+) Transcript_16060:87-746(+)